MTRIVILGGPKTGKTTLAGELWRKAVTAWVAERGPIVDLEGPALMHTDDVMHLGWSEASETASKWFDTSAPWIIEGVAAVRALRKWRDAHPGERPPVDRVIALWEPHVELTPRQGGMMEADLKRWREDVCPWLRRARVRIDELPMPGFPD